MSRRRTALKILIFVPYMLVLYILQAMLFPYLKIAGTAPLILPLAVSGAALFNGRVTGGVIGIVAGMLCDMSFNQPTIVFTIFLAIAGVILGAFCESVLVRGFPSYLLSSLALLIACAVVQMFPLLFFRGVQLGPLLSVALVQTLYSLLFTIPVYYLARFISRLF